MFIWQKDTGHMRKPKINALTVLTYKESIKIVDGSIIVVLFAANADTYLAIHELLNACQTLLSIHTFSNDNTRVWIFVNGEDNWGDVIVMEERLNNLRLLCRWPHDLCNKTKVNNISPEIWTETNLADIQDQDQYLPDESWLTTS